MLPLLPCHSSFDVSSFRPLLLQACVCFRVDVKSGPQAQQRPEIVLQRYHRTLERPSSQRECRHCTMQEKVILDNKTKRDLTYIHAYFLGFVAHAISCIRSLWAVGKKIALHDASSFQLSLFLQNCQPASFFELAFTCFPLSLLSLSIRKSGTSFG